MEEKQELDNLVFQHFNQLFKSQNGNMMSIINCIPQSISKEHNRWLIRPVSKDEVRVALFSMDPNKSQGLDGMSPGFYQHYWDVIGTNIVHFCDHFMKEGYLPAGLTKTHLVFIPKKSKPENVSDLRPIALCNVLYKLAAKVVANRLKPLLGNLISEAQSAFIPRQLITDNIMIAFEMQHYLKRKKQGKVGYGALKLDMSKAYERLEWSYLKEVMKKMGFCSHWIDLISKCISTVKFHILLSNSELGPIIPERGIKQGDHFSPYLFILDFEGLSSMIHRQTMQGGIHGITVARGAPNISHLLFADDSFIFFQANEKECFMVRDILAEYEEASG